MSGRIGPVSLANSFVLCHSDLRTEEVELKSLELPDDKVQKQTTEVLDDWDGTSSGWVDMVVGGRVVKVKVFGVDAHEAKRLSRVEKVRRALAAYFSVQERPVVDLSDPFLLGGLEEEDPPLPDLHALKENALRSLEATCYANHVQVSLKRQGREVYLGGAPKEEVRPS